MSRINWSSPDIIGRTFGQLTVQRVLSVKRLTNRVVECRCECGTITQVLNCSLTSGTTRSCGCLHDCHKTHGETKTPTYNAWQNCRRQTSGRKGVKLASGWEHYEQFLSDMGYKPSSAHFLGRINKREGFTPQNCKWTLSATHQLP